MAEELIGRDALERIIRRAAELQAGERDIGEGLKREDLLALGKEVGIPVRYLEQALVEERTRGPVDTGWLARLAGPAALRAALVHAAPASTFTHVPVPWYLLQTIAGIGHEVLSPQLTAALWRVLAAESQVRYLGTTVDRAGRPGEAVAADSAAEGTSGWC